MEKQPRISTYVDEETIAKFKIVAALNGKSMSKYLEDLIQEKIEEYKIDDISAKALLCAKLIFCIILEICTL